MSSPHTTVMITGCIVKNRFRMWDMSNHCLHNTLAHTGVKFLCCYGYSGKSCDVRVIWRRLQRNSTYFALNNSYVGICSQKKCKNTETIELIAQDCQNYAPKVSVDRHFCAMSRDYHVLPVLQLLPAQKVMWIVLWRDLAKLNAVLARGMSLLAFPCGIKPYSSPSWRYKVWNCSLKPICDML